MCLGLSQMYHVGRSGTFKQLLIPHQSFLFGTSDITVEHHLGNFSSESDDRAKVFPNKGILIE